MNPEQALEFIRQWWRAKSVPASGAEHEAFVQAVNVLGAAIAKLNKSQKPPTPEPDRPDEDLVT